MRWIKCARWNIPGYQGKIVRISRGRSTRLLSNRENLTLDGRKALKKLLNANKRLNAAYLLKESFGQLWSYQTEGWARRFFDNWKTVAQMAAAKTL